MLVLSRKTYLHCLEKTQNISNNNNIILYLEYIISSSRSKSTEKLIVAPRKHEDHVVTQLCMSV